MRFLGPTRHARLNEAGAVVFLIAGLFLFFSLISYYPLDPSWNTATSGAKPVNLTGLVGASISDLLLQGFGLGAYVLPILILMLAWQWLRGAEIAAPWARLAGGLAWVGVHLHRSGSLQGLAADRRSDSAGGLIGLVTADYVVSKMNLTGAVLVTGAVWILSLYLISTFEMSRVPAWFAAADSTRDREFGNGSPRGGRNGSSVPSSERERRSPARPNRLPKRAAEAAAGESPLRGSAELPKS